MNSNILLQTFQKIDHGRAYSESRISAGKLNRAISNSKRSLDLITLKGAPGEGCIIISSYAVWHIASLFYFSRMKKKGIKTNVTLPQIRMWLNEMFATIQCCHCRKILQPKEQEFIFFHENMGFVLTE